MKIERKGFIRNSRTAVSRNSWLIQAFHNRLIALVLIMIVLVPLFGVPADMHVRGIAIVVLEGLAIILATMLLWDAQLDLRREKVVLFLQTGPNLPVLLFLGLSVALAAVSPHKAYGIQNVLQLGSCILVYFAVGYQFRQSKHLSMLVDALLFLAVALSFLTTAQYMLIPELRGTALFGNQQLLGSLLMVLLPIVAAVAMADKQEGRKLVAQAATVLTAGALMLAQTRSAWLGAAAGLVVTGLLAARVASIKDNKSATAKRGLSSQKHKFVMPVILVVVSLGFVAAVTTQNSGIASRGSTLSDVRRVGSFQDRLHIWQGAIAMIKDHPLGVGPGLYPVLQNAYTGVGVPIFKDGKRVAIMTLASQAHNFYLQTAAEVGLAGLALFLIILIVYLVTAARRIPQMDEGIRRTLLIASVGSVVAFSIDAVSSPSWQFGQVSMFLWLTMGIGISCLRPRARQEKEI